MTEAQSIAELKRKSKRQIMLVLLILLILTFPAIGFAAPSITGYSGTLSHGQSVTLAGSGFGTKSTATPLAFGDMENNSLDARIGEWSTDMPHGYPAGFMTVSSQHPRHSHSTYSAVCNFAGNSEDSGNEYCSFGQATSSNTWFLQYWFYEDGTTWGDGNVKQIRLRGAGGENFYSIGPYNRGLVTVEGADEGHGAYYAGACPPTASAGWYPATPSSVCGDAAFGHSCNCGDWLSTSFEWRYYHTDVPSGTWHLFQWEYKEGTTNGHNGVVRWWVDGRKVFDHSDVNTSADGNLSKYLHLLGWYSSHGSTDLSGHVYFDDAYADTTWQRIEIGDNANYDSCTHREVQLPTAWSNTSTTFTVNQGSFANSSTAYVFVTDADGTRNTGYSVTFGVSAVINGACGSASGLAFTSLTSGASNLCATGSVASFTGSGPWTWGCNGSGGGTSTAADACAASLTTYGASGQTTVVLGKGFITGVVK